MTPKTNILLIEDDKSICNFITTSLENVRLILILKIFYNSLFCIDFPSTIFYTIGVLIVLVHY